MPKRAAITRLRRLAAILCVSGLAAAAAKSLAERMELGPRKVDGGGQWFTAMASRYEELRGALADDRVYRYELLPAATDPMGEAQTRGFGEFLLAPACVDMASASPWVIVDGGDEVTLDAWLNEHDARVVERPGSGVMLVVETRP